MAIVYFQIIAGLTGKLMTGILEVDSFTSNRKAFLANGFNTLSFARGVRTLISAEGTCALCYRRKSFGCYVTSWNESAVVLASMWMEPMGSGLTRHIKHAGTKKAPGVYAAQL